MWTRRIFGPPGTAVVALLALLGAHGGAHALVLVPNPGGLPSDATAVARLTYAKETLLETSTTRAAKSSDTTTYYDVVRSHYVVAPAEVAGIAGDTYVIIYTLEGMVFASPPVLSSGAGIFPAVAGNVAGSDSVIFRTGPTQAVTANEILELRARFAISEAGSGSITRTVLNRALEGIPGVVARRTRTASGIIRAIPALKETIRPQEPAPQARVAHDFMAFGGSLSSPILRATLGSIVLGVATPNLEDARGADDSAQDIDALSDIAPAAGEGLPVANPVTFSGDFSFVKTLALSADCTASLTELRIPSEADSEVLTDLTFPRDATTFSARVSEDDASPGNPAREGPLNLCIAVDGKTEIPVTEPYAVTIRYKGIPDAAFPPVGGQRSMAVIVGHDDDTGVALRCTDTSVSCTSVAIPFLVGRDERYRQHVSIVNLSGRAIRYRFAFTPEAGTRVAAGAAANGTVAARSSAVLDSRDIVSVAGKVERTAATLTLGTSPGTVSVGITLVNRNDGSTAVVHAHP